MGGSVNQNREATMGKGKLYNIWVKAKKVNGAIEFSANTSLPHGKTTNGVDIFTFDKSGNGMLKTDVYLVQFNLDDKTTHNLRFPQVPSDALWACRAADQLNPQNSCPTTKPSNPSNQLKGLTVLNDHCLLAVNNDSIVEEVSFALNFLGDNLPGGTVQWDPIGSNQDGGNQ
jgi:hypothetical protein